MFVGAFVLFSKTKAVDTGMAAFLTDQHRSSYHLPEPPKWLTGPPQSQLTVIGSDVHIKCSVSGKPPPDITWRRNGELFRGERG